MELSKRLEAVASLADPGGIVADVGCDHGYVGIWLIQQKFFSKVIAMDVRPGPLEAARKNIQLYQVEDQIEIRLSDGVDMLSQGEADCMICAGMGGALTCRILNHHLKKVRAMKQVILQPQSEIHLVRKFLRTNGFRILREEIVMEDGKYYPMMKAAFQGDEALENGDGSSSTEILSDELQEVYDYYGQLLLEARHPVLKEWLLKERVITENICMELQKAITMGREKQQPIERLLHRLEEVSNQKSRIQKALVFYDN